LPCIRPQALTGLRECRGSCDRCRLIDELDGEGVNDCGQGNAGPVAQFAPDRSRFLLRELLDELRRKAGGFSGAPWAAASAALALALALRASLRRIRPRSISIEPSWSRRTIAPQVV
jgi:hypothetical protein